MINVVIFLLILICDQVSKNLLLNNFSFGESLPIIKNIFHITLVFNSGIAFGLLKNYTAVFSVLSSVVIILISFNIVRQKKQKQIDRIENLALYLILAGAIGNLIDRLRFGFVVDFLDFRIWPVFNIADSAITIGLILLLIRCIRLFAK
jgi:signal peptidase II